MPLVDTYTHTHTHTHTHTQTHHAQHTLRFSEALAADDARLLRDMCVECPNPETRWKIAIYIFFFYPF